MKPARISDGTGRAVAATILGAGVLAALAPEWPAVLKWIDDHDGAAAWMQGLGSVVAIVVTWKVARLETRRAEREREEKATRIFRLLDEARGLFNRDIERVIRAATIHDADALQDYSNTMAQHLGDRVNSLPLDTWPSVQLTVAYQELITRFGAVFWPAAILRELWWGKPQQQTQTEAYVLLERAIARFDEQMLLVDELVEEARAEQAPRMRARRAFMDDVRARVTDREGGPLFRLAA
jgi:hypothetical protein